MLSELSSVERLRVNRAAFLGAAGMIGVIVGIVLAEIEFYLGMRLEEVDHRAGVFKKRIHPRFVEMISCRVLDVGLCIVERVIDAGA